MFEETPIPSTISNLVEQQFPRWYQEHGPVFIEFIKSYYLWMEESGNPLFYSRNYYNIKEIDRTTDEFILHFKEKYLKNIQLNTQTDTQTLVKHALDIYRSKGTERGTQLLFQLVFDKVVKFYYPSTDLFKLSDGHWYLPIYLELMLSDNNNQLVNKEIQGFNSKAVGFVDSVVRRHTQGRLQDVAYISAITGNFMFGEKIFPLDESMSIELCPTITGSLTDVAISVLGTGENFAQGDVVTISSTYGAGAKGIVLDTISSFGVVDASLVEGGYGYTESNNALYVSEVSMSIANLQITNTGIIQYFNEYDLMSQPQVYLHYNSANGVYTAGEPITTYLGNGSVMGTGVIFTITQSNTTAGLLLAGLISGNLQNTFYTTSNAIVANLDVSNGYYLTNATGKFIANDDFLTMLVNNAVGTFLVGEQIIQPTSRALIDSIANNGTIIIRNISGIVSPNYNITGLYSGAVADISNITTGFGLINAVGTFFAANGNVVTSDHIRGTISKIELGSGFQAIVTNTTNYSESVLLNDDLIADYLGVEISAATYGFPGNTAANLSFGLIDETLSWTATTIGKKDKLLVSNPGQNYTKPPFIVVKYAPVQAYQNHDYIIAVIGTTSSFLEGDIITQADTDARGKVLSVDTNNNNILYVQNMKFYPNNKFIVTSNTTTKISSSAGASANIATIDYSYDSPVMGHNLILENDFSIGNNSLLNLKIVDSGFGFVPNEVVTINDEFATGIAQVIFQGVGHGYYRQKGGFLSDQKKLFDGWFWQNYSYQVISSVLMNKYEDMLKQITHVAGTIMFGKFKYDTVTNNVITLQNAIVTI